MNQGPINGVGEVVLYKTPNGEVQLDVRLERETVWLTQLQMATLFGTTPENVLMHLKNVYAEKELGERSTTKDFLAIRTEGKRQVRRKLKHYKLDATSLSGIESAQNAVPNYCNYSNSIILGIPKLSKRCSLM